MGNINKMFKNMITLLSLLFFLLSSISILIVEAVVPTSAQFKYVNEGEFGPYVVEYDGNYRALDPFNSPFQLCFYNTTPNAFTLALRMGTQRSESLFRWVWEANRGNPVKENATLSFGSDGNLVLADADGKIAWQTNTSNKGVVGFKLLSNGNIVLHDSNGEFVWQSFDHPTDTLLVGQGLRYGDKLVSRKSTKVNENGNYSFEEDTTGLRLYYKAVKTYLYFTDAVWNLFVSMSDIVRFGSEAEYEGSSTYQISLNYHTSNSSPPARVILTTQNYNSTLSFLRLSIDGNLKAYTYNNRASENAWEETFTLFSAGSSYGDECQLPEKCGNFGICGDNQCVTCPLPSGSIGWNNTCEPVKVNSCKSSEFHYYKIEGVDHLLSKYSRGQENDCSSKCTSDCKCLGYFYNGDTLRCWLAYDLKTLTKSANSTHVGYIKAPNN
ncbi:hypothetical protein ACFE04_026539 [Oxalis oulophora]